ncbi:DNA-binding domain-containing protein [Thiosulfativibrio zosterae]|uniref:Uncharacterized protein n=1 Tax=Thiosulfativibrio zosterae TaxID=2675053 RepID=A0A6F8PRG6_9GAMM|nr:putative DNA-binding domain-containing protein [Thiosulfativibrio zosterae]BBP44580.1 hypothetical protein THMIRHAT_23260 [Thiosulfativibrio zosterae]
MNKLPAFQQLQNAFTQAIRAPEKVDFSVQKQPGLVKFTPEKRRLDIYQALFFNNLLGFFNSLFPILSKQLGEQRCQALVRAFMQQHHAQTPLFHELGQEFLAFLQTEYQPTADDPAYLLELAHYEWVELAVSIEPQEGPLNDEDCLLDWQAVYQLSPVAWPLAYEWPVHEMQASVMRDKPEWPSFLLVFRDDEDAVQQMVLSPILYEMLLGFMDNQTQTAAQVLSALAAQVGQPLEDLQGFAEPILQQFIEQNLLGFVE